MAEEMTQDVQKITVDGQEFVVSELPEGIQGAVATYGRWQAKAQEAQEELNIVSAALRDLGANIVNAVREVAAADAAAEQAAAEATEVAPELVEPTEE